MSQSSMASEKEFSSTLQYLEEIKPVLEKAEPEIFIERAELMTTYESLVEGYALDFKRLTDQYDLLFQPDVTAYGERAAAVFDRWEEYGGGPTLPCFAGLCMEHFGFDPDSPLLKALFVSSVLAEVKNDLQFHGNEHYRKVMFHTIRLIATHNQIFEGDDRALNKDDVIVLLICACIHDLGHEGGDNQRDGVYTPGYMEQKAFDISQPYFEACGLNKELMQDIKTIIFCTDITFSAGTNSPCARLKMIYRHYFINELEGDVSMIMMGKLRVFEDNPKLADMAMILHEADIATSAALTYQQTIKETIDLMEERGLKTAGPETVLKFLCEQLNETLFAEASLKVLEPGMKAIIEEAQFDKADGRENYYD